MILIMSNFIFNRLIVLCMARILSCCTSSFALKPNTFRRTHIVRTALLTPSKFYLIAAEVNKPRRKTRRKVMHSTPRSVHRTDRVFDVIWFFVFAGVWLGLAIAVCLWPFRLSLSFSPIPTHFLLLMIYFSNNILLLFRRITPMCFPFNMEKFNASTDNICFCWPATWLVSCDLCRCRGCRPWSAGGRDENIST